MVSLKKFDNGLTLIVEPLSNVRSVSIGIFVGVGSGSERPDQNGLSHFIEHMNFKGTSSRSAREIAETLDSVGGKLNAYTSKEHTSYYATVLNEHFDLAIELLEDIVFNSVYKDHDITTEKKVVLEEISMYEDTPDEIIHDLFVRNIWSSYHLGQPVIGSRNVVNNITRDNITDYLKDYYVPENMTISIAGNISLDDAVKKIRKLFAFKEKGSVLLNYQDNPIFNADINYANKDTEQVHLCFGSRGLSYHDNCRYHLLVLSSIIGGSMSSMLFQEIREKRGLAYSIFSYPLYFKNCGLYVLYAGTNIDKAKNVLEISLEIIEKLKKNIPSKMVQRAREQLKGNVILNLEGTSSKMAWNGKNYFYYGKLMEIDDLFTIINSITEDDLYKLLNYIFDPKYYSLSAIGNFQDKNIFEGLLS